jgi:hypothetical protein
LQTREEAQDDEYDAQVSATTKRVFATIVLLVKLQRKALLAKLSFMDVGV